MSSKLRKILACVIVIVVLVGWYITVFGMGSLNSIKDVMKFGLDINGGVYVVMEAETDATGTELDTIMEQTRAVLDKRVNAMGISEATVSLEGNKRIRIEIPGVEDVQDAIANIGRTAQLRFLLADRTEVLTGEDVKDAGVNTDTEHGGYLIQLEFTADGAAKFEEATRKAANGEITSTNDGIANNAIIIMLDDEIVTAPFAQETISSTSCVITSNRGYSLNEASSTAALIRGGALPVGLTEITSSVQTATIGADAQRRALSQVSSD